MKLIIDILEEYYNTIIKGVSEREVVPIGWVSIKNGTPLEAQPTAMSISDKINIEYAKNRLIQLDKALMEMYMKGYEFGLQDWFKSKTQPTNMRDATEEERESVKDYVDSISKPTGVNFNELLRDCGTCKHNTGIDCGQYPCNECNRRTYPLYEPKIAQPTDMTIDEAIEDCEENDYGQIADWLREFKAYKEAQPTDADCINREDLNNAISELTYWHYEDGRLVVGWDGNNTVYKVDDVTRLVHVLPPIQPQRKRGEWNFIGYQMFECSSCRNVYTQDQFEAIKLYTTDDLLPKCCPTCGSYNGEDNKGD